MLLRLSLLSGAPRRSLGAAVLAGKLYEGAGQRALALSWKEDLYLLIVRLVPSQLGTSWTAMFALMAWRTWPMPWGSPELALLAGRGDLVKDSGYCPDLSTRPRKPGFEGHPIEFMIVLDPDLGPLWTHLNPFVPTKT